MRPLSGNGQTRFMRGEIIRRITGSGQITEIRVAPLPYMEDGSNLSPSTYLTTIAPYSRATARPSKRNFCNCSIESATVPLPSPLSPFNDHRIHCLHLETIVEMKLAKVRRYVARLYNNGGKRRERVNNFHIFFFVKSHQKRE